MDIRNEIIPCNNANKIMELLTTIPSDATLFFDIDDTIISPIASMFKVSPYKNLIDDIKANSNLYDNYEEIVGNWRLQRHVSLTDQNWPTLLEKLKKSHNVFALTKMHTGSFGSIKSVEEWRYNELHSLGIEFSQSSSIQSYTHEFLQMKNCPQFYNGIFFTGFAKKSEVLEIYNPILKLNYITMVDDSIEQLNDLSNYCKHSKIGFLGILFTENKSKNIVINHKLWDFQKKYLLEKAQWLEEEAALIKMNS